MVLVRWGVGVIDLRTAGGGKTLIRIYCMKQIHFQ